MQPPLPCLTKVWHNDTYDEISPSRPELKVAGKTVVIIGAGTGIGRETAVAFSAAGAANIHLLGRTQSSLEGTASAISSSANVSIHSVDISSEIEVQKAARAIQQWDVLILAAGYCSTPSSITNADIVEWWRSYEVNVKGTLLILHAFSPTANNSGAKLLVLTTGTTTMPGAHLPGLSAYITAKLAQTKLVEFFAAEAPHIFTATVHPGMVETTIFKKSGARAEQLPMDQGVSRFLHMQLCAVLKTDRLIARLPAHFLVWMCSDEASFLKGKTVWANWDVKELRSQAESIANGQRLTAIIDGWPYGPI